MITEHLSNSKSIRYALNEHIYEKITNLTTDGYTKEWNKNIAITAYADTREQSRLIDEYLNNSNSKFKRIIQNK